MVVFMKTGMENKKLARIIARSQSYGSGEFMDESANVAAKSPVWLPPLSSSKGRQKHPYFGDMGKQNWSRATVKESRERHKEITTYIHLLQECSNMKARSEGKQIHDHLVKVGLEKHPALLKRLVNMYGKCGDLETAHRIFKELPNPEIVCWNSLISAYTKNGDCKSALNLFKDMQQKGIEPSKVTLICTLNACASPEALAVGKHIHTLILGKGFKVDHVLGSALINMYGKCGSLEKARKMFEEMPEKNVVSWNTLISVYTHQGENLKALALYRNMREDGVKADKITFLSILNACTSLDTLKDGRAIEEHVLESRLEMDLAVATALFNMYCKCKSLEDAQRIFNTLSDRNVISWSAIISAYAQDSQCKVAFKLYKQMLQEGVEPDKVTYLSVLNACAKPEALGDGKQIHASIVKAGLESDVIVGTALINMYSKCGDIENAQKIFSQMPERNVVSWSTMISAYLQFAEVEVAIQLLEQMMQEGVKPNRITWVSILEGFALVASLERAKYVHEIVSDNGFESDVFVGSALVNLYAKCGSLIAAQFVFNKMPERNLVSWNSLITAYAQHGSGKVAFNLLGQMQLDGGVADEITLIGLLSACNHAGLLEEARHYFAAVNVDGISALQEHYACMIDLLGRARQLDEAEDIMNTMPYPPNIVVLMTLLGACRIHGDVERGRRLSYLFLKLHPNHSDIEESLWFPRGK